MAQPALSQQVAELEEELGVSLLHRSARGVRPTPAGEALYREAVLILRQIEKLPEIVRYTGGEVAGSVSLGMSSTLASSLAGDFMKACRVALPMVNLSFVTEDSLSLKTRIAARSVDLAILFEESPTPGLLREPLFRQRLYLIQRKPRTGRPAKSVTLAQVGAQPLVLASHPNALRSLLDARLAAEGIAPQVAAEANMLHGMLSAVQAGVGAAVIPMGDFTAATGGGGLVALPIEPPILQTAHLVSSADAALTPAGEAVRALLGPFVQRVLDEKAPPGMQKIEP